MLSLKGQKALTPTIISPTQNPSPRNISCDRIEPTSPKLSMPCTVAPTFGAYPIHVKNSPVKPSMSPSEPSPSLSTSNTIKYGLFKPTSHKFSSPYTVAPTLESCPIRVNNPTIQSSAPPFEPSTSPSTSNTITCDLIEPTSFKPSTPYTVASPFESCPIQGNFHV